MKYNREGDDSPFHGRVEQVNAAMIVSRPDLMQFKRCDDEDTGTNEDDRIDSDGWDDYKAGVLLLWLPKHPEFYGLTPDHCWYIVANGHHRLEYGRKCGVECFNCQVLREADGWRAQDVRSKAAEINIADGKGSIHDQVKFIRNERILHGDNVALQRAARIGARGVKASTIALKSTDPLFDSFINERITADHAVAIAAAAPTHANAQRIGIVSAAAGRPPDFCANLVKVALLDTLPGDEEIILFGDNDKAMRDMEANAAKASELHRNVREQIMAVRGAAKRPELAGRLGVNVKNPIAVARRVDQLKAESIRWDNWPLHPDLVTLVTGRRTNLESLL